jgi:signal transduction histidine kinase
MESPRARTLGKSSALAVGRGGTRSLAARTAVALGIMWASVAVAALAQLQPLPTPVSLAGEAGETTIVSVGIGSEPWQNGLRPGMAATWWSPAEGQSYAGFDVDLGEFTMGFGGAQPKPDQVTVQMAIVLGVVATLLVVARLPAAPLAAALSAGIALGPVGPLVGLPTAIPLMLMPAVAVLAVSRLPEPRLQRRFDLLGGLLLLAVLLSALGAMAIEPPSWGMLWLVPIAAALAIALCGELTAIAWRLRHAAPRSRSFAGRLLLAAIPAASASRVLGAEDERSRIALEIHNEVLPRVATELARARADDPETAATLEAVATELRRIMSRNESIALKVAGLGEALRSHAAATYEGQVRIEFELQMHTSRPPADVEAAAYRIGQAAIDNSVRHSGADRVIVRVTVSEHQLELLVRDDGVGLDAETEKLARKRGRLGLAQMRQHAEAVGGQVVIRPARPAGTEILFTWRD